MPKTPDYNKRFEIMYGVNLAMLSALCGFMAGFFAARGDYTMLILLITMVVAYFILQAILHIFAPDIPASDE